MRSKPVFSIIVPVFNQLDFTKEFLESVRENVFFKDSYEIIVIDNASTDGTREFFESTDTGLPIRYVRNETNTYVTPAWNQGIAASEGDFVFVMNNDITLFKNFDLKMIYAYEGRTVCPTTVQFGTEKPFFQRNNINGTCWMIRRSDYVEEMPNELKLWYSDDFMYHRYGVTWLMSECVTHWGSKTIGKLPEANPIISHDTEVWKWILKDRGWTDVRFAN